MNGNRGESIQANLEGPVFDFATQLVDNSDQLELYDRAKWNLLGHADKDLRFHGHHPWLKRRDNEGIVRALSIPVFSGFSAENRSVMVVRKDPWTHHLDPASWLVAEQNLETGTYVEPQILSVSVDAARQLWLQIAPDNYTNWPRGYHPSRHAPPYDQLRVTGRLDEMYHTEKIEYKDGLRGEREQYEDLEILEMMIVAVQIRRQAEDEARIRDAYDHATILALGSAAQKSA